MNVYTNEYMQRFSTLDAYSYPAAEEETDFISKYSSSILAGYFQRSYVYRGEVELMFIDYFMGIFTSCFKVADI